MTTTDHRTSPAPAVPAPGTRRPLHDRGLFRLADAVLQPGFVGTTPPEWLRRRLNDGLGGVVLFARNIVEPVQLAALTAALVAENPDIVIAVDEESGDVTRLDVATGSRRPGNHALGAVDDPALTEAVAADIGAQLAAAGITMNYAPTADVNNNPNNPVIGVRSFGADPALVARHTAAWVRGLQSTGVAACAKHFPGHGDTGVDSHHGLPIIEVDAARLGLVELPPFRAAIDAGVRSIMTAHLLVPALDQQRPATMSPSVLVDLLREQLGFTGLIVTDGIEMASVSERYGLGGAAVLAIAGGADAICVGGERADEATVELLRNAIVDAVVSGELPESRLVEAAERVAAFAADSAALRTARAAAAAQWEAANRPTVGLDAARRALRVSGEQRLPLPGPAHVIEFTTATNLAIEASTPWGVGEPLRALRPDTTVIRLGEESTVGEVLAGLNGGTPVLVCRDPHRHPWLRELLHGVVAARPDTVVVEMGVPAGEPVGGTHVATYGAAAVCGQAAAELLAGHAA
ncbi:glycoside hydrolase family 3 protein [Catellatospora tritici]|uniref:glycoside hydrolase family 3 protein n=1 Tax=Catellatospora tritici TaxID=2851566 RepID=UPI001C2D5BD0|nr:glycoside hydrolase family 3 N-terminal domain-containing protein [Catellatospora tritici]MBV1850368.1 glycoside hydrolase family 3 protein [Catellatospora tritici]